MADDASEPKKSLWKRLNEKPPGWDEPRNYFGRLFAALFMGLGLFAVRWWLHR